MGWELKAVVTVDQFPTCSLKSPRQFVGSKPKQAYFLARARKQYSTEESWEEESNSCEAKSGAEVSEKASQPARPCGEGYECVHSRMDGITTMEQTERRMFRRVL